MERVQAHEPTPVPAVQANDSRIRKREFRNLKTSWIEAGDPSHPILLFLHGFPDSAEIWEHQIEFFKERFHVICPFVRGALPSDPAESLPRYTTRSEALDVLQILKAVDPKQQRRVLCVGHDLGTALAWRLAPLLAKRLAGLVILNGLSLEQMRHRLKTRPRQLLKSWYVFPMLVPFLPEFAFGHFSKSLLGYTRKSGGLPELKEAPREYAQQFIIGPLNQYRAFTKEIFSAKYRQKIEAPTLVLWSNRDNYLLHPTLEELEPFTSEISVRILEGQHWIHHENPKVFNSILNDFTKRCFR